MIEKIKELTPNWIKVFYHKFRFLVSNIKYGFPNKKLRLIGVTGSSGKSTTAFMIYHILKNSGKKVGLISTVGAYLGDEKLDIGLHVTTPDAHNLPRFLDLMVKENTEYVVVEASSHALDQGRLGNLKFITSVFTNITSDHLDWHKTWENYVSAKAKIVDMTRENGLIVINEDDTRSYEFLKPLLDDRSIEYKPYSLKDVEILENNFVQKFVLDNVEFSIPIIGSYNISNALAAIITASRIGITLKESSKALESFKTLPGHMEVLQSEPSTIIMDFAHNTDALEQSLIEINSISKDPKIVSLFGSAGLRDRKKRYDMGVIAGKLSDIVVIVPEDPRTESLFEINSEILRGCGDSELKLIKRFKTSREYNNYLKDEIDIKKGVFVFDYEEVQARVDGIELGIKLLKKNDILITQGKGHEESMCFGQTEYPYNEKSIILNKIKET